jgi:hypothetical protein
MAEAMPSPGSIPRGERGAFAPHEPFDYAQGRLAVAPSLRERMFALALAKFLQRIPFDLFANVPADVRSLDSAREDRVWRNYLRERCDR